MKLKKKTMQSDDRALSDDGALSIELYLSKILYNITQIWMKVPIDIGVY